MKKYILLLIGLVLLVLDFRIGVADFPAFREFYTEAPNTVNLVINHVVGNRMMVDVLSDALGFLVVMVGAVILLVGYKKEELNNTRITPVPDPAKKEVQRLRRCLGYSLLGLLFYVLEQIMPFYFNGNLRYRAGYGLFYLVLISECIVIGNIIFFVSSRFENMETHTFNNLTTIFAMISMGCYGVCRVLYFYDLTVVYYIYYIISIIFLCIAMVRFSITSKKVGH